MVCKFLMTSFSGEEILLENVELILEAFDYLQLPLALKTGRVGKLSIRIPWKKLGWDPIIIVIEDVFVCACPREDSEITKRGNHFYPTYQQGYWTTSKFPYEMFISYMLIPTKISNDLFYKQKGTRFSKHLSSGQHSFLHWADTARELLVSIRFDGPGWQWSGSFFTDRLGDAQVKMRNSASGVSNMVRVEVQNADIDTHNKKVAERNNSITGTMLILLSDDKTGFEPYRIDNFSVEKLLIYQQRCESIETIVYPYTSCQYAWDEPCYPHHLTVEVPGERSLGTYNLDILSDDVHVSLPSTPEKAERRFCISVHAEGAIKVLSIIDSNCHNMDTKEAGFLGSREPKDADQKQELELNFTEVIKIHLPFMGISLISSSPRLNRVLRIDAESHHEFFSTYNKISSLFYYTLFSLAGIVVCFCQGYDNCCHAEFRSAASHG